MVEDGAWGELCAGLVSAGVCCFLEEHEVFQTGSGPLLNGLFGVSKEETTAQGVEICRLIMNLVPLNNMPFVRRRHRYSSVLEHDEPLFSATR